MRKIGVITTSRADYGIYLPILRKIKSDPQLRLCLIAAGMHLSKKFGFTYKEIEADGFKIDERVDISPGSDSPEAIAQAIGETTQLTGKQTILITLAGSRYDAHCRAMGCRVAAEGFADRAYNRSGALVPRTSPGALITDPEQAAAQAVKIALEGKVVSGDGVEVALAVQTICCHSDTPGAPEIVAAVRETLEKAGVRVRPLSSWFP